MVHFRYFRSPINCMMRQKFYWIFLWLICLVFSCSQEPVLEGEIENVQNKDYTLYVLKPNNLKELFTPYLGEVLGSTIVGVDGHFSIDLLPLKLNNELVVLVLQPSDEPVGKLELNQVESSNFMPITLSSDKSISIKSSVTSFQKDFSILDPSATNKDLMVLVGINQESYATYLKGGIWDLEEGSNLLDKEAAILHYQKELMNFADSTSSVVSALSAIRLVSPNQDYERIPEFLVRQCNRWEGASSNDSLWIRDLWKMAEAHNLPVLKGDVFPDSQWPMISGDTISIKSHFGSKLTIVDLWASWCAPCRKENRMVLRPLYETYRKQGLEILAYGLESDRKGWEMAIEKDGAENWPHGSHLKGDDNAFMKEIRVQTIPANFILDSQGVVLEKNLHGEELSEFVKTYFKTK